jgi:PKD repeat protein
MNEKKTCLKLRALLLAAATVIAVSACGGGSDGGGPAPTPSAPPPPPPPPPPVSNTVPVAAFSSAATGVAGSPIVFDASASADADGDALTYSWAFGNGLRGGGRNIAHVFDAAGNYTVRLTVDDGRGGSAFVERSVSVTPGPAAVGSVDTLAIVRDATGTPLAGVTVGVVNGSASAATGADGRATLATARGAPVTLKFSRSGYADQFKRFTLPVAAESGYIEVTMLAREPAQTLADAAAGGTLTGKNGARITLPPASLVDANGNPVSGPVQIAMTPVDVAAEARAFPGRFEGVGPDGTEGLILSYGTVEFILTQNNVPVQLAPGKKAAIEIPVYTALNRDRTPVRVGDTYPLWSLNERTGTWVQEGTGTVVAASTPSDLALRGEVTHFSWWNHDIFDVPPYKPKPRCLVDTNYDGIPEDLTNTGYCSHEASPFWENQQAASSGQVRAQAEPRTQRIPAWVASTSTPVAGGVELPVPADMDIVFQSYALNGSLYARTLVRGASGASQDIDIVLQPVQNASGTVPITLPWNQVYAMSHAGEVDRFSLAAQAGQSFTIVAGRSNSSILGGNVVVRNPAGAAVGSAALGAGNASITINNAVAGTYTIEVAATANAPGAYRLQAQPLSSNCASAAALVLPTDATHPMTPNSALCFTLDLAADQVIDLDLPSRGSLSGSLQLRAPSDEVIARDTFQNGVARVPGLRLGVAQAGRYQVEIVNNSTASGTVRLRGSNLAAQQISLPQQVTVTDMGSGETRRFVLKRPSPAADFAAALAACNGSFTAGVYPTRTFTSVNFTSSCATGRAVRIQAHAMNALVLPVIDIARNSTTVQTPGEFTLTTSTPTPVALDNDVRLTAPPEAGAIAYTFEGTIGQEVTLGNDVPGSSTSPSPVSVRINAPDGTALLGTGSAGIFTLPLAGLYTVEVANPSSYIGSLRFRLNSVTAPVPLTLTPPLTERSDTLALGQVRRYTFDLNQAEVFTLRLASPDTLSASASVGDTTSGSATVLLTGNTAPQFASTGGSYARTTGQRVLVVRSSSSAEARSTGAFTVGVQKPVPIATALGAAFAGSVTARQMLSYGIAIPTAGYHVLRWQHTAATSGQVDLSATLWAPTTPFANYTGELSIFGGEVVGGSRAGENVTLLQTGSHTLTALNRNDSGTIDYTMSLVALEAPVDLVTGGAATSGSIGVAGERDYYRFAGTASQSYTLNVTAGFGGNMYVRRLPGSGNHTDRAATTLATFPRMLSAGVPLSAAFTIPADQGGVYIVEIDGDQAATGSYTVQLTSP